MSLSRLIFEIEKRESIKEKLYNELLEACGSILQKLSHYKDTSDYSRSFLPKGVIGRRLSDKLYHLEKVVSEVGTIEKLAFSDFEKIQKALLLIVKHMKTYQEIFPADTLIEFPDTMNAIANEFSILSSLQQTFTTQYIEWCTEQLRQKIAKTDSQSAKTHFKNAFVFYQKFVPKMSYNTIVLLKTLNDSVNDIYHYIDIHQQYKISLQEHQAHKESIETYTQQKESLRASSKHLTHLEKCEKKAILYLEEIDKYTKKYDDADPDTQLEIEELILSYQDAHKIMTDEIERIKIFLRKEYDLVDIDDYEQKLNLLQVHIANTEIKLKSSEKSILLLSGILTEFHKLRKVSEPTS